MKSTMPKDYPKSKNFMSVIEADWEHELIERREIAHVQTLAQNENEFGA